ncbi:zinc-binding dehydrogenase [Chryseobacterium ginsenosidimutans]|uniref:zinc-binding dehydrogenase n=1 Tax=Chryseobacterium ginsenosidimutans TaxID=687846 RepID=UPI00216A00A8|nr:zinc-binding dehydrogenase [Chryseobacterium ginsenosidimutans]
MTFTKDELKQAKELGADVTANAKENDPESFLKKETGGMHGMLVTAPSTTAFNQALSALRRKGVLSLNGLPSGTFDLSICSYLLLMTSFYFRRIPSTQVY